MYFKGYSGVLFAYWNFLWVKNFLKDFQYYKYNEIYQYYPKDNEARIIGLEFKNVFIIGVYVPTSGSKNSWLDYKIDNFNHKFHNYLQFLKTKKQVIAIGDFNVALHDIDVYNTKKLNNKPSFTLEERESF